MSSYHLQKYPTLAYRCHQNLYALCMESLQSLAMDITSSFSGHTPDDLMELTEICSTGSRAHMYSSTLSEASSTYTHNLKPGSHLPFTCIQMGRPPGLASTIPKHTSASNITPAQSSLLEMPESQTVTPQPKKTTKKTMSPNVPEHWDPPSSDHIHTRREMTVVTVSLKVELQNTSN